jgi:hypothetical protein
VPGQSVRTTHLTRGPLAPLPLSPPPVSPVDPVAHPAPVPPGSSTGATCMPLASCDTLRHEPSAMRTRASAWKQGLSALLNAVLKPCVRPYMSTAGIPAAVAGAPLAPLTHPAFAPGPRASAPLLAVPREGLGGGWFANISSVLSRRLQNRLPDTNTQKSVP